MEKVQRIGLIQKDLYEQMRAITQRGHHRYQRKSCTFSKKLWRVTKAQVASAKRKPASLAPPVKQLKLGESVWPLG